MNRDDDQLFRPERCPVCGYDLRGLAESGRCPECGEAFASSPGNLVLLGWRYGAAVRRPPNWIFTIGFIAGGYCAASGLIGLIGWLFLGMQDSSLGLLCLLNAALGAAILTACFRSLYRRRPTRPADTQLWISPGGYAMRRGFGRAAYQYWSREVEIDLQLEGEIAHLRIARLLPVGTIEWATLADFAFLCDEAKLKAVREYIAECRSQASASR